MNQCEFDGCSQIATAEFIVFSNNLTHFPAASLRTLKLTLSLRGGVGKS